MEQRQVAQNKSHEFYNVFDAEKQGINNSKKLLNHYFIMTVNRHECLRHKRGYILTNRAT